MPFADKLFNAAFAREASGGILNAHENQLDMLREKLQQIATLERQKTLQDMAGQQAMERLMVGGEQAMDRLMVGGEQQKLLTKLREIGAAERNQATIKARGQEAELNRESRVQEAAASAGVVDAASMSREEALSNIAMSVQQAQAAQSDEDRRERFFDLYDKTIDLKKTWPGLDITPFDLVEGRVTVDQLSGAIANEQARMDELERLTQGGGSLLTEGTLTRIAELPPEVSGPLVDQMIMTGSYPPSDQDKLFIAATTSKVDKELFGIDGARKAVQEYKDTVVASKVPSGLYEGGMFLSFDKTSQAKVDEARAMIDRALVPGSRFDQELLDRYGKGVVDVLEGAGPTSIDDIVQSLARNQEKETTAAQEEVSSTFPDQQEQVALDRQALILQGIDQTLQQQEDPAAALGEIIGVFEGWVEQMSQGLRPTDLPNSQVTIEDLNAVLDQLRARIGG